MSFTNEGYFLMHSEEVVKSLNELIIKIRNGVNDSPRNFIDGVDSLIEFCDYYIWRLGQNNKEDILINKKAFEMIISRFIQLKNLTNVIKGFYYSTKADKRERLLNEFIPNCVDVINKIKEAFKWFNYGILEILEQSAKKNHYKFIKHGNNIKIILIGETHSVESEQEYQKLVIRTFKPEFVLHELFAATIYTPKTRREKEDEQSLMRGFSISRSERKIYSLMSEAKFSNANLIKMSEELKIPFIGCDISQAEQDILFEKLSKKYPKEYYLSNQGGGNKVKIALRDSKPIMFLSDERVKLRREKVMSEIIIETLNKTKSIIICILGGYYVRSDSLVLKFLRNKSIDYVVINQYK